MTKDYPQLIAEAKNGSQQAMTALYEATHQQVYYSIRKLVGNDEDAADLAQETYIKVLTNLDKLSEPMAFPKWCRTIAVNLTRDHLKRSKPVLFSTDEEEQRVLGNIPIEDEDCLPAAYAEQADLRRQVVDLIDALPEAQRMAVYLFYFEERSVSEVAAMMEVNENTIKSRLNYARAKLKELAKKNGVTMAAVPVLTLLLRNDCSATVVPGAVNKAVLGAIGTLGAAAATGTTAAVAGTGAAAGTVAATGAAAAAAPAAAATAAGVGIGVKIAAIVAAAGVLVGGGIGIGKVVADKAKPDAPIVEEQDGKENEESAVTAPSGGMEVDPYTAMINAFIGTVDDHGGLGGFLGLSGDEILEALGEDLLQPDSDPESYICYVVDNSITFQINDGVCWSISSFSEQLPVFDGVIGLSSDELESMLSESGLTWYRDSFAAYDSYQVYPSDADAAYAIYTDDARIDIVYWDAGFVSYDIHSIAGIQEFYGPFILHGEDFNEALAEFGGATKLLGMTRDEIISRFYNPHHIDEDGAYHYGDGLTLCFSDPAEPWGEICTQVRSNQMEVFEGYFGLLPDEAKAKLESDGKQYFASDFIEGDPRAEEYWPGSHNSTRFCFYEDSIRYNVASIGFAGTSDTEPIPVNYLCATYYPEGMDWLEAALEQQAANAQLSLYDAVYGYEGVMTGRLMADLTHDGTDELIICSVSEDDWGFQYFHCTVYTIAGGEVVELHHESTDSSHANAYHLALYEEDGAYYLLAYNFYLNQGYVNNSYQVYHPDSDSSTIMLRQDAVSGPEAETAAETEELEATINTMLETATVLFRGNAEYVFTDASTLPLCSALPDGVHLIRLSPSLVEVEGGVLAHATLVAPVILTDEEVAAFAVGGTIDLTRFGDGYYAYTITHIQRDSYMVYIEAANGDYFSFYPADGGWHLYYNDPNGGDTYAIGGALLYFVDGQYNPIERDDFEGSEIYTDIRDVSIYKSDTFDVTIENGMVTDLYIYWHP